MNSYPTDKAFPSLVKTELQPDERGVQKVKYLIKEASESELKEIYELAGENRLEATNDQSIDNQMKMLVDYEHARKYNAYFLCLKEESTLIGWILIDRATDYLTGRRVGWISDLYVKKEHRNRGFANLLIEEAFHEFKNQGYSDVRLNVYAHNVKAIKLYEKIGFKDVSKFMKIEI